tara:strand:+ start:607 stop:822 length:216 start_codon:yes stop_codon:yes gene_type:complete
MKVRVLKFGNVRTTSPVVMWTSEWVGTGKQTQVTNKSGHTVKVATHWVRGIVNPEGSFGFIVNKDAQLLVA